MKRVFCSVQAHLQNWQSRHFEKTKMGRQLAACRRIHEGETCVIVGNGPSLKAEDLQRLHELGIVTFGTNRIYHIFDRTDWRPTYYVSEDALILGAIRAEVEKLPAKAKFIPINLRWYEGISVDGAMYFYLDYSGGYPETRGLSLDIPHGIRCRGTVTATCIQLAVYMGFSEIYLLGVDHNYSRFTDEQGNLVEDPGVKDYFCDHYDGDFKACINRDLGSTTKAYADVQALSEALGSFRVYNATRGGKLEIFRRVDFDAVFGGCV